MKDDYIGDYGEPTPAEAKLFLEMIMENVEQTQLEPPPPSDEHDLHFSDVYTPPEEDEPAAIPVPDEPPYKIPRGKYKGLVLPRMIGVKPSKLQEVEALRAEILRDPEFTRHASSIAQTYALLRIEAEEAAAVLEEIKTRLTAVMLIMNEQYECEDTLSIRLKDIGTIRVEPQPHAIVVDRDAHRRWCLDHGYEEVMYLAWGTTNRLTKEMLLAGRPEPEGVTAFMRPKVVFTEDKGAKALRAAERERRK